MSSRDTLSTTNQMRPNSNSTTIFLSPSRLSDVASDLQTNKINVLMTGWNGHVTEFAQYNHALVEGEFRQLDSGLSKTVDSYMKQLIKENGSGQPVTLIGVHVRRLGNLLKGVLSSAK